MPVALLPVVLHDAAGAVCCSPQTSEPINEPDAYALAVTLKALADPMRLRLMSLIAAHDGGEACICDLVEPVGLSQPTVSHHMKVLVEAGLVRRDKRGVMAYYTLLPGALGDVVDHLASHLGAATAGERGTRLLSD